MSSAVFLSASSLKVLQCPSKLIKYCLSVKKLGSGRDVEVLGVSSGSKLFAYDTIVLLGRLRVNADKKNTKDPAVHLCFFFRSAINNRFASCLVIFAVCCIVILQINIRLAWYLDKGSD